MPGRLQTAFTFLFVLVFINLDAQTNCDQKNLVGEWKETLSLPGVATNLDSLKNAASSSKKNVGIWNFMADMRYTYFHALHRSKYKKKSVYVFDTNTCEIVLGTKPNARERANLEILYLDNEHLIYKSDNNPKGYFTHVLVRYKKRGKKPKNK
jgi:hypothetical protein